MKLFRQAKISEKFLKIFYKLNLINLLKKYFLGESLQDRFIGHNWSSSSIYSRYREVGDSAETRPSVATPGAVG